MKTVGAGVLPALARIDAFGFIIGLHDAEGPDRGYQDETNQPELREDRQRLDHEHRQEPEPNRTIVDLPQPRPEKRLDRRHAGYFCWLHTVTGIATIAAN